MSVLELGKHSASENPIDRHFEVIEGTGELSESLRQISDLRALPFVVLLGEPGSYVAREVRR